MNQCIAKPDDLVLGNAAGFVSQRLQLGECLSCLAWHHGA